ncbi:putative nucleoredoxin 1 [Silene latifolia]|uniref:putative nucleoredoxin 1 n=1 Tax=Silene latifolia TaxID=37657 RepID=UPI003D7861E3
MRIPNVPLKSCSVAVANENKNSNCRGNPVDYVSVATENSNPDGGEYIVVDDTNYPVVGMRLAVVPFLSNNGKTTSLIRCSTGEPVGFDVVLRKHLLICCASFDLFTGIHYFRAIMDVYNSLSRDKFEMVFVANSNSTKPAFDEFVSELPCLAIPFSDLDTRHYICSFIGFNHYFYCARLSLVLVDPDEMILYYRDAPDLFLTLGPEWFPYRDSDIEAVNIQDHVLRCRLDPLYKKEIQGYVPEAVMQDALLQEPLSLYRDILHCDPSLALPRFGSVDGARESLTVLELSKRHVVMYLCVDTSFLHELIDLYKECKEKKLDLEILVVWIPLFDFTERIQENFIEDLRRENITSWLLFPKHNNIWRRLWRVFSLHLEQDRMIVLPPNGKPGELEGRGIVEQLGVTEYPFTRTAVLEQRYTALRSLTPDSLFKGTTKARTCLFRKGKERNVRQSSLRGKKLLVYLDWLQLSGDKGKLCDLMMKLYPKIKAKGWEVVFVPLDSELRKPHVKFAKMLWPTMPIRKACEASVREKLIFEGDDNYGNQVIAFNEDGKIVSREAHKGLRKHKLNDSLFYDKLYDELTTIFVWLKG